MRLVLILYQGDLGLDSSTDSFSQASVAHPPPTLTLIIIRLGMIVMIKCRGGVLRMFSKRGKQIGAKAAFSMGFKQPTWPSTSAAPRKMCLSSFLRRQNLLFWSTGGVSQGGKFAGKDAFSVEFKTIISFENENYEFVTNKILSDQSDLIKHSHI